MNCRTQDYRLEDFICDMTDIVIQKESDAEKVSEAEKLLAKLIRSVSWLPREKKKPSNERYARHSLYLDPQDRFEVLVLVWQPGQQTPLHDHDGTWGVEGVVDGQIKVTNYVQEGSVSEHVVKLRNNGTMIVNEHSTGKLLPPADCHIIETAGDQSAITIHVYGKQLSQYKIYKPVGEEGLYSTNVFHLNYTTD